MITRLTCSFAFVLCFHFFTSAQEIPISNYSVAPNGQAQISFQAEEGKYYMLHAEHSPTYEWALNMAIGVEGTMVISDPAGAYPIGNYSVTEHSVADPDDFDGDGIDDLTEYNNMPTDAPLNFAEAIDFTDGTTSIPDAQTFMDLATVNNVPWAPFLDDQLYVKFGILNRDSPEPQVYFINSNTHVIHAGFWSAIDANVSGDDGSGEIVFNPNAVLPGGVIGTYSFNFSFGETFDFEDAQRTYELLAANMPFLQNNLNHFIGESYENQYLANYQDDYEGSRIDVALESEVFAEVNFLPFHQAEGYGFFRHMENLGETPGSRDIVLYDALPNSLPRVGGIITSVIQTPLSHVNLRAIQDNVPNAYIEDPLEIDSIANLLGGYIYYKVENESYEIREASLDEVNAWYEALRPTEPQFPVRDLSFSEILALDDIGFEMSTGFGAKCSNLATMRTFGFPDGTIPDGFGIPFYYYDEFMKFNGFYAEAQVMIDNPIFQNDINFRINRLDQFRKDIRDAPMPAWMMDDLQAMHDQFPAGTPVRCRSSTNNEDLPGFSGAGLYTSKTQYPDEGHISKSIKQIYSSMWNFRAYEERDFYRIDHFMAAMGVLCHPNYQDEKSNGVGISIDPIYETENTFYLNTQVGESLITNPDPNSVPEEILLYEDPDQAGGFLVLRLSNLVEQGQLVMDLTYLNQMREYLSVIHDEFAVLYDVVGAEGFAMDIEYKVTAEDQLIIKQARPWVSFWADITSDNDLGVSDIIAPASSSSLGSNEIVKVEVGNFGLNNMSDFNLELIIDGASIETLTIDETIEPFSSGVFEFNTPQDFSEIGSYEITCILSHPNDEYENNDTLNYLLNKIPDLDASIAIAETIGLCDDNLGLTAVINNLGQSTISNIEVEVYANGELVEEVVQNVFISLDEQYRLDIIIDDYLQEENNEIFVILSKVNGQFDEVEANNLAFDTADLETTYDLVTLLINTDNYPSETTWDFFDQRTNKIVASGDVDFLVNTEFTADICLDYTSCFTLNFYDSYGDGICCSYGEGNFAVYNSNGEELVYNDGEFAKKTQEVFCPDGTGCAISAEIDITHVTDGYGALKIYPNAGVSPFMYSIDGGEEFQASNSFYDLAAGEYEVVIMGATGACVFEETVLIEDCTFAILEIESVDATDATTTNGSIIITPSSSGETYQYSIDGGINFVDDNVFSDLAVGEYNVVVLDAYGVCEYELLVPIEAIYAEVINDSEIVINEINYNSADDFDTGDWVELYNSSDIGLDLSGWEMKDDDDSHSFVLPQETVIEANGFLILTRDKESFLVQFPELESVVIGDFDFGLSSNGDAVRLYNSDAILMDAVYYESDDPWPTSPDGEGFTLELLSPSLDNSLAENWAPINFHGSPDMVNAMVNTNTLSKENYQLTSYPNPFSDQINLALVLEDSDQVLIKLYDQNGRMIKQILNSNLNAGEHVFDTDLSQLSSGVYYAKVFVGNYSPRTVKWVKL
jgi:hypothetical protein